MMMDLRFNILDPYVDRFIVCEAKFTHSGEKKEINFNVNDFPDFKNKIVHLVMENEPENISLNKKYNSVNLRIQSIKRIQSQRKLSLIIQSKLYTEESHPITDPNFMVNSLPMVKSLICMVSLLLIRNSPLIQLYG